MVKKPNQVIYSSDLIIRDNAELATLCVFFDKVFLPYTTQVSSRRFAGARVLDAELPRGLDPEFDRRYVDDVDYWWGRNKLLFEEQVIERLPAWQETPATQLLGRLKQTEKIDALTKASVRVARIQMTIGNEPMGQETPQENLKKGIMQEILIKQDLLLHFLRDDLKLPQLLISDAITSRREYLKALEAKAAITYVFPTLSSLMPEEMLEIRSKVSDNREGFSMYLQELSKDIEDRLDGGESPGEVFSFVESIIETKLVPYFYEFKRQLVAERTVSGNRVLDSLGRISEIDAPFSSAKFWIELLRALGLAIPSAAEQKERASNKSQAFQFMRTIEDFGK